MCSQLGRWGSSNQSVFLWLWPTSAGMACQYPGEGVKFSSVRLWSRHRHMILHLVRASLGMPNRLCRCPLFHQLIVCPADCLFVGIFQKAAVCFIVAITWRHVMIRKGFSQNQNIDWVILQVCWPITKCFHERKFMLVKTMLFLPVISHCGRI